MDYSIRQSGSQGEEERLHEQIKHVLVAPTELLGGRSDMQTKQIQTCLRKADIESCVERIIFNSTHS